MVLRRAIVVALLLLGTSLGAQQFPVQAPVASSLSSATCPGTGCVTLTVSNAGAVGVQVTGTWAGTLQFLGSVDRVNFSAINCTPPNSSSAVTTSTANGTWTCGVAGLGQVQVGFNPYTSGTAVVTVQASEAGGGGGGGGGGAASSVTINDPSVTSQKLAINASGQASVTCANCSGSGASAVDNAAFTVGSGSGAPSMGYYNVANQAMTSGRAGLPGMDINRNMFAVLHDAAGNLRGANVSAGNALLVDASATTQPVSGTIAATESGTWTVQPGNTANTTAWLVAGGKTNNNAAPGATNLGALVGLANAAAPTYVEGDQVLISTDLSGSQRVNVTNPSPSATADGISAVPYLQQTATHSQTATMQSAAVANGNGTTLPTLGESVALLTVNCASCAGGTVVNFEVSEDATNYVGANSLQLGTNTIATSTTTAGVTVWEVPVSGSQLARARISAYSAGTITVTGHTVPLTAGSRLTKVLVTPDSVALPANQSTNVAQLAGTATSVNSGTKDAGTLRVVLATDQPQLTNKLLVTPDSVALPANQSVNLSQVNAVTVLTGVGAAGTGTQRIVDVASGTTGAAPPTQASFIGGIVSGATGGFLGGVTVGDSSKGVNISTATTTLMITGVAGRQVRITSFHLLTNAANNVAWLEGTGATCGTGTAGMAGGTTAASGYNFAANGGIALGSGVGEVLTTVTTGDSVCLITSAATQLSGFIKYAIY